MQPLDIKAQTLPLLALEVSVVFVFLDREDPPEDKMYWSALQQLLKVPVGGSLAVRFSKTLLCPWPLFLEEVSRGVSRTLRVHPYLHAIVLLLWMNPCERKVVNDFWASR